MSELSPQLCAADVWVSKALHRHIIFIVFTCHTIHVNGTIHPFTHNAHTRCWKLPGKHDVVTRRKRYLHSPRKSSWNLWLTIATKPKQMFGRVSHLWKVWAFTKRISGFQVTSESYGFLRLLCGYKGCHIDLYNDRCEITLFRSEVAFCADLQAVVVYLVRGADHTDHRRTKLLPANLKSSTGEN